MFSVSFSHTNQKSCQESLQVLSFKIVITGILSVSIVGRIFLDNGNILDAHCPMSNCYLQLCGIRENFSVNVTFSINVKSEVFLLQGLLHQSCPYTKKEKYLVVVIISGFKLTEYP